jgi:hypothetical protein
MDQGSTVSISAASVPSDGIWHHVAAVSDATGVRLYVDGLLEEAQ